MGLMNVILGRLAFMNASPVGWYLFIPLERFPTEPNQLVMRAQPWHVP